MDDRINAGQFINCLKRTLTDSKCRIFLGDESPCHKAEKVRDFINA